MKKTIFDTEWKYWIYSNINNGVDKREIYRVLMANDFDEFSIINELRYIPTQLIDYNHVEHVSQNLTQLGAKKIEAEIPLFIKENVLSHEECQEIVTLQREHAKKSTVGQGENIALDPGRVSFSTNFINELNTDTVMSIKSKILGLVGLPIQQSETLQGQWYKKGGFYNHHFDAITNTEELKASTKGNRTWTCMINLNNVEEGGGTYFKELDQQFSAKEGQAIIWYNLNEHQLAHPASLHTGLEIEQGEKFILTQWFRQIPDHPA